MLTAKTKARRGAAQELGDAHVAYEMALADYSAQPCDEYARRVKATARRLARANAAVAAFEGGQ